MKEMILNTFKSLGFEMEDFEELGYGFDYEGLHYLWMNSDDEEFLSIAIPAVLDKADTDELRFYQVMDKLNSTLKFVKVHELGNSMWLFYEREILDGEDFEKLLPKMILYLEHAVRFFGNGDSDTSNNDDNNVATSDNNTDDFHYLIEDIKFLDDNN